MSHDKRALQKQAQETFIYLAGNIRLGVKMSSSTTTRLEENKKRLVENSIREASLLLRLGNAPENTLEKFTTEEGKLVTLGDILKMSEDLGKVPKRNKVV